MENKKIVGYEYNGHAFDDMEEMFEWLWTNNFTLDEIEKMKEKIYPVYLAPLEIEAEDLIDEIIDNFFYGDDIEEKEITSDSSVKDFQEMINLWIKKYGQRCIKTLDDEKAFDFPIREYLEWRYKRDIEIYGE